MIIKIIKIIKEIINDFIEKPSIIMFLVNIFNLFNKKDKKEKCIENKEEEETSLLYAEVDDNISLKIIVKCNQCNSIIESEMYCYKDNLYCSELCRLPAIQED